MSAINKSKPNYKGPSGDGRVANCNGSSDITPKKDGIPDQQEDEQGWCYVGKKQVSKQKDGQRQQNRQKESGQRGWPQQQERQKNAPQKIQVQNAVAKNSHNQQQSELNSWQRQNGREASLGGSRHAQQQKDVWRKDPASKIDSVERGTIGIPGTVEVNYVTLDLSDMPNVAYHYDVQITPKQPTKFYRAAFEQFQIEHLNGLAAAFDGKASCYTVDKLPVLKQGLEVQVVSPQGRNLHYTIEIKETDNIEVDLGSLKKYLKERIYDKPMRALQCLEVVLAAPCHQKAVRCGRSFFKTCQQGRIELIEGYELLIGLHQSLVLGDYPIFNVDIAHKTFPMALTLIEYLERFGLKQPINKSTRLCGAINIILPFLTGIKVIYEPPKCFCSIPRVYKVNGLTENDADTQRFSPENLTVATYFKKRGYSLKYPLLNCLHVGPPLQNIYLPMELCSIEPNQILRREDSEQVVSGLVKYSATSTNIRKLKILTLLEYFQHNLHPTVSRFGLKIGKNFITVATRLLTPPRLEYKGGRTAAVRNGSWRMDRLEFINTQPTVHKWAVLYPQYEKTLYYEMLLKLTEMVLKNARMTQVSLDPKPDILAFRNGNDLDTRFAALKSQKCDLVFVVIPKRGVTYNDIKTKAELGHGILTQCIKQQNVEVRLNPQLIENIMLKLNTKLNGINHKVKAEPAINLNNVMYLGGDVAHPSPDQPNIPSVVGTVATCDPFGSCYNMQYRLQPGKLENIEDMLSIIGEYLNIYKKSQKRYPEHIIYYRDGVSEGQFNIVKQVELRSINMACSRLGCKPNIACVIVVKRHHTRFFPKSEGDPKFNKFNNVAPGTVVDQVIVHPNEVQFFMVSHQAIQGTARPTRYNVIENTGNLNINLLQQLTYNLCHSFPRCNRSVSYPTPVYLAHLVAARGRVYLGIGNNIGTPANEHSKRSIKPELLHKNPMFFV